MRNDDLHKFILEPHLVELKDAIDNENTAKAVLITVMLVRYKEKNIMNRYIDDMVQELIDETMAIVNSQ